MVTILFKHGNMAGTTDEIIMKRRSWLHFYPNIKVREIIIKRGPQLHNYPNMKMWQTIMKLCFCPNVEMPETSTASVRQHDRFTLRHKDCGYASNQTWK